MKRPKMNEIKISTNCEGLKFEKLSRHELLQFCRTLHEVEGISSLSYPSLKAIPKLYPHLYAKGLSQKILLKELGLEAEYRNYLKSSPYNYGATKRERWSWEVLVQRAKTVVESEGRLPPALWFQKNGYASFVAALYNLGHNWADLREAVDDFEGSNFVQSRNGLRWLSHAEASMSNFLYARGIEHKKGERYDDSYANLNVASYAIFDLHFLNAKGAWIDVEIWGDKPNGHNADKYAKVRHAKESFNHDNPNFLGVHHGDCYDEEKLTKLLDHHIGIINPFKFDKQTDALLYSTHWSNADELLDFCRDLAAKMPNGEFPAEDWLRKRGRWEGRDGDAYNTLSIYIKQWLGGIRNLRNLIGQGNVSTTQWDRESALAAYRKFYADHGVTPYQYRARHVRGRCESSKETSMLATRIASAVQKYAGGADVANDELNIKSELQIKWTKDKVISAFKEIIVEYGLSPNQLVYDHRKGKIQLPSDQFRILTQLVDAVNRFQGGVKAIYLELDISAPKRPSKKSLK